MRACTLAHNAHYRLLGTAAIIFFTFLTPTNAAESIREREWQHADALVAAGKNREGIQVLDHVYALTLHSPAQNQRKQLDEAQILADEIEPLRSTDQTVRLKRVLADFARIANVNSQPQASLFPPMKPTALGFSAEEKLFKTGPNSGLSSDWLLGPDESSLIDKALRLAADAKYADALSVLDEYRGEQSEFFWYYRAWLYAAENRIADSVNAFFLVFYRHTATPNGMFFSVQVNAARHLSALPESALR